MRIAIVRREFMPFGGAGIGTYAQNMTRAWAAAGHDVIVVTYPYPDLQSKAKALFPGVRFESVPAESFDGLPDFAGYARGVQEVLIRLGDAGVRFDYVEFPDYWAEGAAVLDDRNGVGDAVVGVRLHTPSRICATVNEHDARDEYLQQLIAREDGAIAKADMIVSPTRSLLEWVEREIPSVTQRPRAVVPNPFYPANLDDLGVSSTDARRRGDGVPDVLCFGRLERRKGVHVFVDAATHLLDAGVDARFRLIGGDTATAPGDTSMRDWLMERIPSRFRDAVVIEGARPRAELGEAITSARVCVFPALWDNFPNALVEALSLGTCCIGSAAGGIDEIIEPEKNGLLVRPGDVDDLAAALQRVLEDHDLCEQLAFAGPSRITELCNPVSIVDQMTRLISSLAS